MEQLQIHIWLTASSYTVWWNVCAFPHILGSPSSYMTLQLLHHELPFYMRKIWFSFFITVVLPTINSSQCRLNPPMLPSPVSCETKWQSLGSLREDNTLYFLMTLPYSLESKQLYRCAYSIFSSTLLNDLRFGKSYQTNSISELSLLLLFCLLYTGTYFLQGVVGMGEGQSSWLH